MSSIVVCGGNCHSQVRFINWLIGAPLIPVGNAGRSVIVWHVVDGNEDSEKVNVVVHYRQDLGLGVCHDDVYAQVMRADLDCFIGMVVDRATCDGDEYKLGLGFMVDAIHVALRVNTKKRSSVWTHLKITQLPERNDTIDIGRWLRGSSHIVLMGKSQSEDFDRFEESDTDVERRRVIIMEYVAEDPILCVLGRNARWTLATIMTQSVVPLLMEEGRWLRSNELHVRHMMGCFRTSAHPVCKDKRPYVSALLAMSN